MTDVGGEGAQTVTGEFRPDFADGAKGAEVLELGAGQAEVAQGAAQFAQVELGVVSDDEVGAGEAFGELGGDGGELGFVLHVEPGDAVNLREVLAKPAVAFGGTNQPVAGLD